MSRILTLIALCSAISPAPANVLSPPVPPGSFGACAVCHKIKPDGVGLGPTLFRVGNRRAGTVANFAYSPAMKASKIRWTRAQLIAFISAPQARVPGTRMAYAGQKDPAEAKALAEFLLKLK